MTDSPQRPLITFALFAYNQERFITEAVAGAFSQTYSPLQIILSDDCSPDGTFGLMQDLARGYKGPHRVTIRQNECNLGIGAHLNRVMKAVDGELIVVAAGDDVSLAHRTERLWQEHLASGRKAYSIFSNEYLVDEHGNRCGLSMRTPPDSRRLSMEWFAYRQASVTGSSHAWHRAVFDVFGPLADGVVSEDVAIPFRSLLLGSIRYVDEPLVLRRFTGENLSLGSLRRWDRNASVARFHEYHYNHARNFLAVYATRLNDLELYEREFGDPQGMLAEIRHITARRRERMRAEIRFWESPPPTKLWVLWHDFVAEGFSKAAARLTASWLLPRMTMRWQHLVSFNQRGQLPAD